MEATKGSDGTTFFLNKVIMTGMRQTSLPAYCTYFGSLSPTKTGDPVGPMIGEELSWWSLSIVDFIGTHTKTPPDKTPGLDGAYGRIPLGYNQAFSDGHVTWYPMSAFPAGTPSPSTAMLDQGSKWFWMEK